MSEMMAQIAAEPLLAKQCVICREWKPRTDFYASTRCRDGLHGGCKHCQSLKAKERAKRPEVKAQKRKVHAEWREANREHYRDHGRQYASANPDKVAVWRRRYKERNADRIKENAAIRYVESRNDPDHLKREREKGRKFRELNREQYLAKSKKDHRIRTIRTNIALEIVRSLGIDVYKLAKERYDAELRTGEAAGEKLYQGPGASKEDC